MVQFLKVTVSGTLIWDFNLSSADAFNLVTSKILALGKGFMLSAYLFSLDKAKILSFWWKGKTTRIYCSFQYYKST